jgi:polynucleotide 5'-hydroxyl-kinase GRC3/NOL9
MEIIAESEWETVLHILMENKGITVLLGASDTGKTYLARYLIKGLLSENVTVSLVDSDIGQSTLGVPGAVGMKVFRHLDDLEDFWAEKMFFIGSVNAVKRVDAIANGVRKMVNLCKKKSESVIIDTTGLVSGKAAKKLKISKIKSIIPDQIIAIHRRDELEHILNDLEDIHVYHINVSQNVKIRNTPERMGYRKKRIRDYFDESRVKEYVLQKDEVKFFYKGVELHISDHQYIREGTLIGLNHKNITMALGAIIKFDKDSICFKSPVKSLEGINRVVLGNISI